MKKERFYVLRLNLVQSIIVHKTSPTVVNCIVAIIERTKNLMVVRPEWRNFLPTFTDLAQNEITGDVIITQFGDGFRIDTWDDQIANFK
jgi:hypothetical protein